MTVDDLEVLASYLYERHGTTAVWYIGQAVEELEAQGEFRRAETWRLVHAMMLDLAGIHMPSEISYAIH